VLTHHLAPGISPAGLAKEHRRKQHREPQNDGPDSSHFSNIMGISYSNPHDGNECDPPPRGLGCCCGFSETWTEMYLQPAGD
jgi:hypothetical protein